MNVPPSLVRKVGVFSVLIALHGLGLWWIAQPTMLNPIDLQTGALEVMLLEAKAPSPQPDPEPDVAPQILPMRVIVRAPNVIEPVDASDAAEPAATSITQESGEPRPSAGEAGEPELKPPDFEADYLANPAPNYPPLSRQLHEQGATTLRVHVAADGKPLAIEIDRSSGYERLDRAAISAVWQWRFVPARRGSTPVAAWVIVPIRFNLHQ